jgi:hypothetical protein
MFSENDLVARSKEDMSREVEALQAESMCLRGEHAAALKKEAEMRRESVESRPSNPKLAEALWLEAERLKEESKELLRLSMEKRLRAAEVQRRIDIHDEIESLDTYDEIWRKAVKAAHS